jgi:hypothetical protein
LNAKSPRYIENLSSSTSPSKKKREKKKKKKNFPHTLNFQHTRPRMYLFRLKTTQKGKFKPTFSSIMVRKKKKEKTLSLPQIFPVQMTTENAVRDPSP